jgi:hypothetical protein
MFRCMSAKKKYVVGKCILQYIKIQEYANNCATLQHKDLPLILELRYVSTLSCGSSSVRVQQY